MIAKAQDVAQLLQRKFAQHGGRELVDESQAYIDALRGSEDAQELLRVGQGILDNWKRYGESRDGTVRDGGRLPLSTS